MRYKIALSLLKKNFKNIILFEIIYKLVSTTIFTPILIGMINFSMKLAGINYLTNKRFMDFILRPSTIAIIILALILLSIFCLIEIGAIISCFDFSYHNLEYNVIDMFKAGIKSAFRLIRGNNFLLILFILIIMPISHLAIISGYVTTIEIPAFVVDGIQSKGIYIFLTAIIYFVLCIFAIRWITSLHFYVIEKCHFKQARKNSVRLNNKKYLGLIITYGLWEILIIGSLFIAFAAGSFIITNVVKMLLNRKLAYTVALYICRKLFVAWLAVYSCITVPITFAYFSGYYYSEKNIAGEHVSDLACNTRKKINGKVKKALLAIVIVCGILNLIYSNFNIRIFKGFSKIQLFNEMQIAAHRGDSKNAPENTMAAIKSAIDNMADFVEIDIQETMDGEVILMHDSNLLRTTGVSMNVWESTYDNLKNLDAGSWFSKDYKGEPIPTLEQVIKETKGKIKYNIEIKLTGHEKNIEHTVAEIIDKYNIYDDCIITSFQAKALKNIKTINPKIKTGYILQVAFGDFSGLKYADALSINYSFASEMFINNAHNGKKAVLVWTVNSDEKINEMIENGADMIITDNPVLAREVLTTYETNQWLVDMVKYFMD